MPKFRQLLKTTSDFLIENSFLFYSIIILIIGFFTYFFGYQEPQAPFWDENFHVAASQKYIDDVFFVELHPPLGKLLIAAGEAIWNPNDPDSKVLVEQFKNDIIKETNQDYTDTPEQQILLQDKKTKFSETIKNFNTSDYIKEFPKHYSFLGVRFFPALLAFLSCYLFFILLFILSKNTHLAFLFSSLYLFNNPLIVHFRGAMLDGIQMFFVLATLVYFAYLYVDKKIIQAQHYLILGAIMGLAISTKINSLILVLIFPFLFITNNYETILSAYKELIKGKLDNLKINYKATFNLLKTAFVTGLSFVFGISLVFGLVQYIHLNLAKNPLPDKNQYNDFRLNEGYNKIVDSKSFANPLSVIPSTIGWYQYQTEYNKGVPKLDLTKPDENGSYPTNWLVGNKAINYRWDRYPIEKVNHNTYGFNQEPGNISLDDESKLPPEEKQKWVVAAKYLYLTINPIIWLISIIALVLGTALLIGYLCFGVKITNFKLFNLIGFFVIMYAAYMISVLQVERVLYLYHYFIALIFALITAFLLFIYRFEEDLASPKKSQYLYAILGVIYLAVFISFIFYAPFSYYLPLTADEFQMRNWFSFWGLKSV